MTQRCQDCGWLHSAGVTPANFKKRVLSAGPTRGYEPGLTDCHTTRALYTLRARVCWSGSRLRHGSIAALLGRFRRFLVTPAMLPHDGNCKTHKYSLSGTNCIESGPDDSEAPELECLGRDCLDGRNPVQNAYVVLANATTISADPTAAPQSCNQTFVLGMTLLLVSSSRSVVNLWTILPQ